MRLAHRMAFYSPYVVADMIDSETYFALASRHRIMAVPTWVLDGALTQEGAVAERQIAGLVDQAGQLPVDPA